MSPLTWFFREKNEVELAFQIHHTNVENAQNVITGWMFSKMKKQLTDVSAHFHAGRRALFQSVKANRRDRPDHIDLRLLRVRERTETLYL